MSRILPYLATALLYAIPAINFWRGGWRATPAGAAPATFNRFAQAAIPVALILHGALLYRLMFADSGLQLGVGVAISLVVWLAALIYWIASFFYSLQGLQMLVIPVAALGALAPVALPSLHPVANTGAPAFTAHLLIALLASGLFTIACLQVILMAVLEKRLHKGALPRALRSLPPLLTMEKLLFRMIATGFVLLTLTLLSGFIFSEELFGAPAQFTHKTIFAVLSWGIFALLLGGRVIRGWRGRIAVRWTIAGFISLLLAYIGSRFVLEVILQR